MNSKRRNITNSVWNLADVAFYPIAFLATTPFFINRLGESVFGLWMLINSLLIGFQIFNFGLAPATVKYIAQYRSMGQFNRVKTTINTNITLSLILFLLAIIIGFFLSVSTQHGNLFNLPTELKAMGGTAIQIGSLIIGFKFFEQILLSSFKGFERYDIYAIVNAVIRFGTLGVNIVQVLFHHSLLTMLRTNLTITIIMLIVQVFLLRKVFTGYRLHLLFRKEMILQVGRFGLLTWLQSIIVIVVFQIDRYIVITHFGPEQLGYYAIAATIFVNIHTILTACITWLIPKLTRLRVDEHKQVKFYKSIRAFITIIGIFALCSFYIVHPYLFRIWLGENKFSHIREYVKLFTIFEFFYMMIIVPPLFMNYSGKEKVGTLIIYIVSILNIIGIIAGISLLPSVEGMLYGLILSTAVAVLFVYVMVGRILHIRNVVTQVLPFILFPVLAVFLAVYDSALIQLLIFIVLMALCYVFFVKYEKFNAKEIFE